MEGFPLFTWGSAQTKGTTSRELFLVFYVRLRTNFGTSQSHLHTATGAAFSAPDRAPINRQSPRRASSRLDRWGFVAIASAALRTEASQCVRVEEGRLFPGDYIDITTLDHFLYLSWF